jgi:hypothetical protein
VPNPITGEGFPNPAPKVTKNWGQLPAGRKWGTSAGIDIDPKDGQIWAYERCGAGTAGGGPVDCDNTPVDPVQAKAIIATNWQVPAEVRARRRSKKGKAPQTVRTGQSKPPAQRESRRGDLPRPAWSATPPDEVNRSA